MTTIIDIVLPVFGLIAVGYFVAWLGYLPKGADEAISGFVFTVAIPVFVFRTLAEADFSGTSPWQLWVAYFSVFGLLWAVGTWVTRRLFGRDARAGVVGGIAASYSNPVLIGIPLITTAYGPAGAVAVFLLIAIHMPIMMTASSLLIERANVIDGVADRAPSSLLGLARVVAQRFFLNPVVVAILLGLAWHLVGRPIPELAGVVIDRLAGVAPTMALVALGMTLRQYGVRGHVAPALVTTALKLVVMPALVFLIAVPLMHIPPIPAKAIVICAACPSGVNVYLVASRFRTGEGLASNAITLSTGLAVLTVTFWLNLLAAV
jgi:predicted permease